MENKIPESILKLNHCVFDEITFRRKGFQTENPAKFHLGVSIRVREEHDYCITLKVTGEKEDEYDINIEMTGYFSVEGEISPAEEKQLMRNNAVAILMPYIRSEVSLLTAQPETQCEILPIINVFEMGRDS